VHCLDAGVARVENDTGEPSRNTSPSSGTTAPDRALISDDLPAPLSPITARISPGSSSRSEPASAVTLP